MEILVYITFRPVAVLVAMVVVVGNIGFVIHMQLNDQRFHLKIIM